MSASDRVRAYRIFSAALDYAVEYRDSFLARECGADFKLRSEVDSLLTFAQRDVTDTRALLGLPKRHEENLVGAVVGRFRLVEHIGAGGMGSVYRAERTDGVQQAVAVKLISTDIGRDQQVRFEREAQLLATLEHPAMARLIDAGVEQGRAWIAMDFVRGERIDEYCAAHRLSTADIVGLIAQLADAVTAAHRIFVVHSDIKPANVLVTADGAPKLIDFGIATALRDADAAPSAARLFSPGFAAPEQVLGGTITAATDVYGLGALAYRLITGVPPLADTHNPVTYVLTVQGHRPEPPSKVLLSAGASSDRVRTVRGDVDAIVLKALDPDPAQRYLSAVEMRADLLRYLRHEAVLARGDSSAYRAGKFVRRHALAVFLGVLLLASLVSGGMIAGIQARRASLARDEARTVTSFLTNDILAAANPLVAGTRDVQLRPLLDKATLSLEDRFAAQPIVLAELQASMGTGYAALFDTAKAETLLSQAEQGLSATLGDSDPETEKARMALWYLYVGNIDIKKIFKLSQRIAAAEAAGGRPHSADALRAQMMIAWIPCVAKAAAIVGLSNCGTVVRPFWQEARSRFGPEALTTYEMSWFVGVALMYSAREDEAEPMLREGCEGLKQFYGPVHHRLTACMRYLAKALDANGKSQEAADILTVVEQNFAKTLGPKSLFTAISELELGRALLKAGRTGDALPVAKRAVAAMQDNPGIERGDEWLAQMLLADAAVQSGNVVEGVNLGEHTLADAASELGAGTYLTLRLRDQLAGVYLSARNASKAEKVLAENLSLGRQLPKSPPWFVGDLEASLAAALLAENRASEAQPLLEDAVDVLQRELGSTNFRTLRAYRELKIL